ncbi:outer membrane lipoprotein LolB [Rhodanobacter glycinis]|uniref:Outer-membrane lipoprotein LolB n=1 Tax=Rhodanobacter glycinis TaxID=582702 RepID=A0A502FAD3_9GAMM|nr:lipoprotein insertase outer membrane protein LolB [Rhodanobacter glycinis]TPG07445.1 outer membrane lipoprotein LolB [Rhodanobacter glycinis]TPG46293.1 outer membrane lipoprotein LolB [Rhodanobacter glycinis]
MKQRLRVLAAVALPLLLAACVPAVRMKGDAGLLNAQLAREQALAHADHWVLQGRLGVSDGKDGGSGSFSWTQNGDQYEFVLRAPITGKSFRLSGDPAGALLEGLDPGPLRGPDAEALMRKALGWEVPLRDLRAWVLGLRADSGPAELSFGADRLPSLLQQDGWAVDYREWDATREPPLPKKVYAEKLPYKVKLSIESWQFQ